MSRLAGVPGRGVLSLRASGMAALPFGVGPFAGRLPGRRGLLHQRLGKPKKKAPARPFQANAGRCSACGCSVWPFFRHGSASSARGRAHGVAEAFALLAGAFPAAGLPAALPPRAGRPSCTALRPAPDGSRLPGLLALARWRWPSGWTGSAISTLKPQRRAGAGPLKSPRCAGALLRPGAGRFAGLVIQNSGFAGGSFAYGGF